MCDYSLMTFPNRLANEGEVLVTHKFSTGSIGFVSPQELSLAIQAIPRRMNMGLRSKVRAWLAGPPARPAIPAVCIPPGARLRVQFVPNGASHVLQAEPGDEVVFTETTASWAQFRDALRVREGLEILLQSLCEGVEVQVLNVALTQELPRAAEYTYSLVPSR